MTTDVTHEIGPDGLPLATAVCGNLGEIVPHKDLVKQYEYNADGLYWTGKWVSKHNLYKPNPQNLRPKIGPDPKPLDHPRPPYYERLPAEPRNLIVTNVTSTTISISWEQIPDAECFVVYWTGNSKVTDNLFNYNTAMRQNGQFGGFPTSSSFTLGDPNGIIPTPSLAPNSPYIIQIASMNQIQQNVVSFGHYNQQYSNTWSYNISAPTNIQYALRVITNVN